MILNTQGYEYIFKASSPLLWRGVGGEDNNHIISILQNYIRMKNFNITFFTEYFQFYILDSQTKAKTDAAEFWMPEADKRRLAIGEGLLGVTVAKYSEIKVGIKILEEKPLKNESADHIVEASIRLNSGILQIKNCTSYELQLEIPLSKANYRIRISSFKLNTVVNDIGEDYYLVEIWKSRFALPRILKKLKK